MSFIPGENAVDDISVMEINTTQGRFSQHIIPEHYFVPTYCMQFILKGVEMWNDKPMSREEEITGRFMHLVDAHCDQHHNLDWYAGQLCLSTRYVANTVKQTLGMTASSCIEFALTQRAKTLLYTTNKSNRHSSECRF